MQPLFVDYKKRPLNKEIITRPFNENENCGVPKV